MKRVKSFRLSDELVSLVNVFSLMVNERFSDFVRRSIVSRIDDLGPVVVKRMALLSFIISTVDNSEELMHKAMALGIKPLLLRRFMRHYLSNPSRKKNIQKLIKALIEKYSHDVAT
jgi:hypothetical protein